MAESVQPARRVSFEYTPVDTHRSLQELFGANASADDFGVTDADMAAAQRAYNFWGTEQQAACVDENTSANALGFSDAQELRKLLARVIIFNAYVASKHNTNLTLWRDVLEYSRRKAQHYAPLPYVHRPQHRGNAESYLALFTVDQLVAITF